MTTIPGDDIPVQVCENRNDGVHDVPSSSIDEANVESSSGVYRKSMIETEEELKKISETQEESKLSEVPDDENATKEICYKRLEHLLNRSKFYTQSLLDKMKKQQQQKYKVKAKDTKRKTRKSFAPASRRSLRIHTISKALQDDDSRSSNSESKTPSVGLRSSNRHISDRVNDNRKLAELNHSNQVDKSSSAASTKRKRKSDETLKISNVYTEEPLSKRMKLDVESEADGSTVDTFYRTINGEKVSDRQPVLFTGGIMRSYQLEGFEWLKLLFENGMNAILGDEMGLGKTIQSIALISHLVHMRSPGPYLICTPLSTLSNWVSEFHRFAPKIPVLLYHGNQLERKNLRVKIRQVKKVDDVAMYPVVVTSYEMVMKDRKFLQAYNWNYLIVDEGHRLKNLNCLLIRELKRLKTSNRLLLTGTPLQNNLSELWSLLNFLLPEIFDDLQVFQSWFDNTTLSNEENDERIIQQEKEKSIVTKLHQILTPFLLRRLKSDVDIDIPPKREVLVYTPLSKIQQKFYKATVDKTIERMLKPPNEELPVVLNENGRPDRRCKRDVDYKATMSETAFHNKMPSVSSSLCQSDSIIDKTMFKLSVINVSLRNRMMQLRKVCNHPYLFEYPLDPATQQYKVDEELVNCCGKIQVMDAMLKKLKERGHKVLVFSQMTKMLDILKDFCDLRSYKICRLDGTMNIEDRQKEINAFNNDPGVFIFLLSTRAGGLGINLTAADTVIIYDTDWNPQCDLQAQDRCHRIGQEKPVVIYRLVTAGAIDEKIVERAASKRKLEKMIIHKGKFKNGQASLHASFAALPTDELMKILKSTEYHNVVKMDKSCVYTEKQLEMLLDRSDLVHAMKTNQCRSSTVKTVRGVFKVIGEYCETNLAL